MLTQQLNYRNVVHDAKLDWLCQSMFPCCVCVCVCVCDKVWDVEEQPKEEEEEEEEEEEGFPAGSSTRRAGRRLIGATTGDDITFQPAHFVGSISDILRKFPDGLQILRVSVTHTHLSLTQTTPSLYCIYCTVIQLAGLL